MMSNYAFWSASGELLAVHGVGAADPQASFGPWSASLRFPSGRLVALSSRFPLPPNLAPSPGWSALSSAPSPRPGKRPKPCDPAAPVAVWAPRLDSAAGRFLPPVTVHEQFTLKAWPTWVTTTKPEPNEGPEGWYAALDPDPSVRSSRFLVRLVPYRGRLPGDGWRNMLAWVLKNHTGVRLVPLNGLPTGPALDAAPTWEYRVEAGQGTDSAAWDVQILPSRRLLEEWAPGFSDPWEATALLRWIRPGAPETLELNSLPTEPRWADLLGRLPVTDARLLVQNFLVARPGGAAASALLFYDTLNLPPGPGGRILVRHVPQDGLPLSLLSVLFGRRVWQEIDRAKKTLPPAQERAQARSEALAELDQRVADGRLVWSDQARELWQALYRAPRHRALSAELAAFRRSDRWAQVLAGDPRLPETLLRSLDVTDAALCLRDVPDARWRRFVTARREAELRAELEFCRDWAARGELTVERELDAWQSWDEVVRNFPLTEPAPGN